MQRSKRIGTLAVATAAFLVFMALPPLASAADDSPAGGPVVAGTWVHRHANFTYWGITALYSCDGLEDNIRSLLVHLGARKDDVKVNARGCLRGPNVPSRNSIIELDFYSLAPSADANAANTADTVRARWAPVLVNTTHPYFMGRGDCELVQQLKDTLSKNFSFRDLNYRTDCVPYAEYPDQFSVKAEALKALPPAVAAKS